MTLQYLQDLIHSIDELRTISGTFTLHGTLCRALGLIRQRETVSLVFLQYNAAYNELLETAQIFELNDGMQACATNRDMLRKEQYAAHFPDAFEGSHTLFIGDASYTINITETGALRMQDWESLVLIAAFLCDGWQPESFLQLSYENLFFSRLELTGSYSTLAEISNNAPLRVAVRPANTVHPVEKTVSLSVGGRYSARRTFRDKKGKAEHWYYIERVSLFDPWKECERMFQDPRITKNHSFEELAKRQADIESLLILECPKGMCYPIVEYESEADIFLQFYLQDFLKCIPENPASSQALMFRIRPDQPVGKNGLPLKACIVQTPVAPTTKRLALEPFSFSQSEPPAELTLE